MEVLQEEKTQALPCPVWLPTGVSTGAIYTIADSQKDKYIQIPLSNPEEPVGNSTWEEGSQLIAQPHRAPWRNSSRARAQLSAEPARETDAAVGRHFSSVRYFVLVDGQPWLIGETRERMWECRERRRKFILLLSPLQDLAMVLNVKLGNLSWTRGVVKTEGQGCKLVPGDNSIIAKMLAKWLTRFPQEYLCKTGARELSNHPSPGSMLLRMEASLAFSMRMVHPLPSFWVSLCLCVTLTRQKWLLVPLFTCLSPPHIYIHVHKYVCVLRYMYVCITYIAYHKEPGLLNPEISASICIYHSPPHLSLQLHSVD